MRKMVSWLAVGVVLVMYVGANPVTGTEAEASLSFSPLTVGDSVPAVRLRTAEGKVFDLKASVAEKPAVLIFYRGGWCPYCTQHLAALQDVEGKIVEAGYQILAISPDRPEKLAETLAEQELSYTLLSDSDMVAAKGFGLAFEVDAKTREAYKGYGIDLVEASGREHYLLPVPAVFVVDQQGVVQFVFAEEDYKVRLEPAQLLEVLQKQGEEPKAEAAACCS